MIKFSKKIICVAIAAIFCFLLVFPVFAIDPTDPQAPNISLPIPGFVGFSQIKVEDESISIPWIAEYVNAIYNYILAIAGSVASFIFIVAGFKYTLARGDKGKVAKAQSMMINALVGLFMTFGAYLILYTINPDLTSFESIRLDVIKRQELKFGVEERESFAEDTDTSGSGSTGSSTPTPSGSSNEYEPMVLRVAEAVGINGCLLARQIRMESNWNTNAGTGCCFGLGQIHWNYGRAYLSQIAQYHSQRCSTCPNEDASREVMSNWLRQDPEGNVIIAALMKKGAIRQAGNPVAAVAMYGMGSGSYNSFISATNCQKERYTENQLLERLRNGSSVEDLIRTACVPPSTWPLPNIGSTQRSCPPANYCCASASGACAQPPIRREGGVNQGRWGVCQGGTRTGQECAAVAGGDGYVRSFLNAARGCAQ